jgi:hypothetical protein
VDNKKKNLSKTMFSIIPETIADKIEEFLCISFQLPIIKPDLATLDKIKDGC